MKYLLLFLLPLNLFASVIEVKILVDGKEVLSKSSSRASVGIKTREEIVNGKLVNNSQWEVSLLDETPLPCESNLPATDTKDMCGFVDSPILMLNANNTSDIEAISKIPTI